MNGSSCDKSDIYTVHLVTTNKKKNEEKANIWLGVNVVLLQVNDS